MSFLDVQTFACIKITASKIYMVISFSRAAVPLITEVMNFRRRVLGREKRDNSQLANKQGVMYISLGKLILTKKLILASSSLKPYTVTSNHNQNGKYGCIIGNAIIFHFPDLNRFLVGL
jgi:hypothetical protein